MNSENAKELKKSIDQIMGAAKNYGNQSHQLADTKENFQKALGQLDETNSRLTEVVTACNDYLKKVDTLVDGDFTEELRKRVTEATEAVTECRTQCSAMTEQYEGILSAFNVKKEQLEEQQNSIADAIDTFLHSVGEQLKSQEEAIQRKQDELIAQLNSTNEKLLAGIAASEQKTDDDVCLQIEAMQEAATQSAEALKTEIEKVCAELKTAEDTVANNTAQYEQTVAEAIKSSTETQAEALSGAVADVRSAADAACAETKKTAEASCAAVQEAVSAAQDRILQNNGEVCEQIRNTAAQITQQTDGISEQVRTYTVSMQKGLDENRLHSSENARDIRNTINDALKESNGKISLLKQQTEHMSREISDLKEQVTELKGVLNEYKKNQTMTIIGMCAAFLAAAAAIAGLFI